jgi:hypothetical protein
LRKHKCIQAGDCEANSKAVQEGSEAGEAEKAKEIGKFQVFDRGGDIQRYQPCLRGRDEGRARSLVNLVEPLKFILGGQATGESSNRIQLFRLGSVEFWRGLCSLMGWLRFVPPIASDSKKSFMRGLSGVCEFRQLGDVAG